jgi:diketogulonate reductase-like aldo/keto reductase
MQKAWADMEKVQADGLTRSIGVSNFLPNHLEAILKTAKVKPAVNQIEFHPYLQHAPSKLIDFHRQHGILTTAYGPLIPITRAQGGPVDDYVAGLAKKYAVNPSEILFRWCVDQEIVAITTTSKEQRMSDFMRMTAFSLTPAEVEEIKNLGLKKHFRAYWTSEFDAEDGS